MRPSNRSKRGASALNERIYGLYPGYFALVMATGIVSNAFHMLGERWLSDALLAVNLVAFPCSSSPRSCARACTRVRSGRT